MKTYEILIEGKSYYFKTNAEEVQIQQAIDFVKTTEPTLDKVLIAIRMLGAKATPVTINPENIFEIE